MTHFDPIAELNIEIQELEKKNTKLQVIEAELRAALEDTTDRYERLEKLYATATNQVYDAPNGTIARNRRLLAPVA